MKQKYWGLILFGIWCFAAICGAMHHEMWRDEMRALSIAIQSPGFTYLPVYLANEGHPILWYLLLKMSYLVFKSTCILPVLSLLFAGAIAWFLLIRSPFPLIFSVLIVFGTWCLYEYGIQCRNYGIAAFLFLLFAYLYSKKPDHIISCSIVLAIVAQTNIYAAMLSMLLAGWMAFETFTNDKSVNRSRVWVGLGIIAISFLFVLYIAVPGSDSLVLDTKQQNIKNIFKTWDVGFGFPEILYVWFPYKHGLVTALLWLSLLAFIPRPKTMVFLFITLMAMSFFSLYYRNNSIYHQGMWIYVYIAMLWINYKNIRTLLTSAHWSRYLSFIGLLVFSLILLSNFFRGINAYAVDLKGLKSDSKDAGLWFKDHLKKDDVVLSEPDYIMEPVMYYNYKPFYLPREKAFNTFVHFTQANDSLLYLSKLQQTADSFNRAGKNTYLVFGINLTRDTVYKYSYNKKFIVDSASLYNFNANYQLLDSFSDNNWYVDEHYFIFKKRPFLNKPL